MRYLCFAFIWWFLVVFTSSAVALPTQNLNPPPKTPIIIETSTNQAIDYNEFLEKISGVDYVILGEYHDSVMQHHLASQLLDDLHGKRPQGSLLLEMLRVDQQAHINKIANNPTKYPSAKLAKALNWQKSWDWSLYGQMVAQPFEFGYELIGTNLTADEVKTLMQGAMPLNGYHSTTNDIKAQIKQKILTAHGLDKHNMSDDDVRIIDNMVAIQQFRDRRMAQKILISPKPTLLLTGNYHAQKRIGIPMHLMDLTQHQPKPTGVVILMSKTMNDFGAEDADFIWIIPE